MRGDASVRTEPRALGARGSAKVLAMIIERAWRERGRHYPTVSTMPAPYFDIPHLPRVWAGGVVGGLGEGAKSDAPVLCNTHGPRTTTIKTISREAIADS